MKAPAPIERYIAENVYCRCGQAVTRLAEGGLIARPELPDSETEVHEWWLVSPRAANALRAAGQPVLQFAELYLWGRTQAPGPLSADPALAEAARPPEPPARVEW